ncbi:hypothetical protein [Rhodocista pekingensis]|uniref:Tetratricopeptide repeat protein n=1 Tax=Rhodocista pekingensis TaxID=201185 RepID=A0ABW2L003_9PROT
MQATRKAVDIRTTLADSNPDAFLPELARALSVLGGIQKSGGGSDDLRLAISSYRRAAAILRPYHEADPSVFRGLWGATLRDLVTAMAEAEASEAEIAAVLADLGVGRGGGA